MMVEGKTSGGKSLFKHRTSLQIQSSWGERGNGKLFHRGNKCFAKALNREQERKHMFSSMKTEAEGGCGRFCKHKSRRNFQFQEEKTLLHSSRSDRNSDELRVLFQCSRNGIVKKGTFII